MSNTILRPFQHINYLNEYLRQTLDNYSIQGPSYFCTYFKFDYDDSIIDDREYIQSGNYHLVDDKSGRTWKKIHLMPLWEVEDHGPVETKASEEGVTREIITSFVIPDYIGIRPTARDFIQIYDNVTNQVSNDQPLFIVTNRIESHMGKKKVYKVKCKNSYNHLSNLDVPDNISSEWIYINHFRKIFSYEAGQRILSTLDTNYTYLENINKEETSTFEYNTNVNMFNVKQ